MRVTLLTVGLVVVSLLRSTAFATADAANDRALWITAAATNISESNKWEYADYLSSIVNFHKRYPSEPLPSNLTDILYAGISADAAGITRPVLPGSPLESRIPKVRRAAKIYEALKSGGPAGYLAGSFLQDLLSRVTSGMEIDAFIPVSRQYSEAFQQNDENLPQILGDAYDLAQQDSYFKKLLNDTFARDFRAAVGETADQILHSNPQLERNEFIKAALEKQGKSEAEVRALAEKILTSVGAQGKKLDEMRAQEAEDRRASLAVKGEIEQIAARLQADAQAARQAALYDYELSGLRAGAFVVASLMGDKKAGRLLTLTVNTSLDFYEAINAYERIERLRENRKMVDAQSNYDEQEGLTEAMFTFQVVAIALKFVNALSTDDRPNPDALILAQLARLADQLHAFQSEVRTRFDRVDAGLNTIYAEMTRNFAKVYQYLADIETDLSAAQRALARQALQVQYSAGVLGDKVDYLVDLPFRTAMSACLNYKKDAGHVMSEEYYIDCVLKLRAYVQQSSDEVNSGAWSERYQYLPNLTQELKSQDWAKNINLIADIVRRYGGGEAFPRRVANPTRWLLATQLYMALLKENPDAFRRLPTEFLRYLQSQGESIATEFNIAPAQDPQPILTACSNLLKEYESRLQAFDIAARAVRAAALRRDGASIADAGTLPDASEELAPEVMEAIKARPINHVPGDNPDFLKIPGDPSWAGAAPIGDISWPPFKAPANIWAMVLAVPELLNAEALGLGKLEVGYGVYVLGKASYDNGAVLQEYGRPRVRLFVYLTGPSGDKRLVATSGTVGTPEIKTAAIIRAGSAWAEMGADRWVNLRESIASSDFPLGVPLPFSLSADLDLASDIAAKQVELVERMRNDLVVALQTPGSDLFEAGQALDAIVFSLRGMTSLVLPNWSKEDDRLRQATYGRPPMMLDGGEKGDRDRIELMPLMTSENAAYLLTDIVAPSDSGGEGLRLPPNEWKSSALLRGVIPQQSRTIGIVATDTSRGLDAAAGRADIDSAIDRALGDLELLRRARDDNVALELR